MAEAKDDDLKWFPFKWEKFIIGTLELSAEEIGAYILLLIYEWDKGFIPESEKELKKISRVSIKKLEKVLEKFEKINGKLYNNTLEIIRIEQTEKNAKNSERGAKAAKVRWDKQKESIAQALHKHCSEDAIRKEEKRKEKKRIEETIINAQDDRDSEMFEEEILEVEVYPTFNDFWDEYDKKVGSIEKLKKKWEKLSSGEREKIMEYIPNYKTAQPDKKYRQNPETFFNNSTWNDELIFKGNGKQANKNERVDKFSQYFASKASGNPNQQ